MSEIQESTGRRLTRGGFLGASAATLGGIALAGCGSSSHVRGKAGVLGAVKNRASAAEVDGFVRLSQLVTGVEKLPRVHAAAYLNALDAARLDLPPLRLVQLGGFVDGNGPKTLGEFQQTAVYRKPAGRKSAEAVASVWWSGMVPTAKGDKVVTFLDALAWRAQPWAQPFTECLGATGAWAKPGRI